MFRNRRCSTVNHTSSIIAIIRIIAFFFFFFSANQAEIQRVIFRDVGHAIPFRDHNLLSPFSFAISEITQRTLFSVYVCVCVYATFFLSFSLSSSPFPCSSSPFPPFFFTSFIEPVIQTEWKVFKRGGPASPPCVAMRDPASFNNGDALPIPLCWMKKSSADGVSSRNILSPPSAVCNFISASAGYPCRCFNANARCQKAAA